MKKETTLHQRRQFITKASMGLGGMMALPFASIAKPNLTSSEDELNVIGPKEGFTPQVGTLVSMMNWMRNTILYPVQGMSVKDLDYLHDDNSNSIGAMLWHLGSTERFYQLNTFADLKWGDWPEKDEKEWGTAMSLGDDGRAKIKGNPLDFYLEKLEKVRENTLKQLAKRDDDWLLSVDKNWFWGPTNNYCKWFHVVEHESNHNGQIKYIKSRLHSRK